MNEIKVGSGGAHYGKIDPFVLTRVMKSSGNAHVDGCRCSIIKYAFRVKGEGEMQIPKMIDDLKKAAHYANEAAECLQRELTTKNQPELFHPDAPECKDCACKGPCPEICDRLNQPSRTVPPWQCIDPTHTMMITEERCADCNRAQPLLQDPCSAKNGGGA